MTPEQHEEVGRIFHAALDIETSERSEFLARACASDSELRKEVEALLALDDPAKDFIENQGWRFDLFATNELYVTDGLENSVEIVAKFCPRCQRPYPRAHRYCADDNHPLSLPDPYHLIGKTLADEYLIEALVGVGGMGAVYSAWHSRSDRRVAFKILQPNLSHNEHILRLFKREVKAAGRLNHENIAKIKDAGGTAEGLTYLVAEWLDGETLAEYLAASGPLSLLRTIEVIRQVVAALEAAHARHVIHRDLKPSNIMIVKGQQGREVVKVLDFGIAKIITNTAGSLASAALGTPQYASPEQLHAGKSVDRRSDIYSLGVLLYQMLTGRLPFDACSMPGLQPESPPPSIIKARPELPAALDQLVSSMLAKDPSQRPQRARDIVTTLDQIIQNDSSQFWRCVHCGQQNQDELKNCLKCKTMPPGVPTSKLQMQAAPRHERSSASGMISLWSWFSSSGIRITALIVLICVCLIVLVWFIGVSFAPDPGKTLPNAPEIETVFLNSEMRTRAPRGKAIFKSLPPIPGVICNPAILRLPGDAVLSLMVTQASWDQLSKEQQIDLTWYLQSLIPTVRAHPDDYLIMLKFHEKERKLFIGMAQGNHRNLCSDCWEIFIGDRDPDGHPPPSLVGPVIVRGDFAWERGNTLKRGISKIGIKASEFRK